jgi:hypothetical protein
MRALDGVPKKSLDYSKVYVVPYLTIRFVRHPRTLASFDTENRSPCERKSTISSRKIW